MQILERNEIRKRESDRKDKEYRKIASDVESGFFPWNRAEQRKEQTRRESLLQDSFSKTDKGLAGKLHEIGKDIVGITQEPKRVAEGP